MLLARCLVVLWALALTSTTLAQNTQRTPIVQFGRHDVRSVFFIAKSENKNQVHYGVRATADCRASSIRPVFAYWRDREVSPKAVSPLLPREERAYGLQREQHITVTRTHTFIVIELQAMPSRKIHVELSKGEDGRCNASATMEVSGKRARLDHIFVQVRTLFGIPIGAEFLRIHARDLASGKRLSEKVSP